MQLLASGAGQRPAELALANADFFGKQAGERPLAKVLFFLPLDWHGHASETLWAEWAGGNQFRLLNAPFFAKGVSRADVIAVQRDDGWLTLDRILARSGHSTVRLILEGSVPAQRLNKALGAIGALGCNSEEASLAYRRLISVDIPPHADFDAVHDVLERGERDGLWYYEEGHCGHHAE